MISHLVKGCLCLRLLPNAAGGALSSTTARGAQRATYYHHHHHRRPVAFGWTGGEGSRSATTTTQAVAAHQQNQDLQELKDVPASTLAAIECVASDVDGTLTTPDVTVTSRTKEAIKAVMDSGLVFFPATGKVSVLYALPWGCSPIGAVRMYVNSPHRHVRQ